MKARNGTTLVEMLVVFTVGGTLLGLGVGMVHQSMLMNRASAAKCDRLHSASRFFERFRLDINSAIKIECPSKDSIAIDNSDGTRTHYASRNNLIDRTHVRSNNSTQRETLTLDEKAVGVFSLRDENRIAALSIQTHHGLNGSETRLDRSIEASIGFAVRATWNGVEP